MIPIDWKTAIQYASLVQMAENVLPAQDDVSLVRQLATIGWNYQTTIHGNELATDISPHTGEDVSYGFLAVSGAKELVVALRGTATIWEWIHDLSFLLVPSPIPGLSGMTEDGFTSIFRSLTTRNQQGSANLMNAIRALLDSGVAASVTVCGHSLGAALATLVAANVALDTTVRSPTLYTFASPRVGEHLFARSFNAIVPASFRVANRQDLVPQLPPVLPLPYEHTHTLFALNSPHGAISQTIPCMHHLTTYLWLMAQQAGVSGFPLDAGCLPGVAPALVVDPAGKP